MKPYENINQLQNDFITALHKNPPDYEKAKKLLSCGLDINAPIKDDSEENLLSSIILNFGTPDKPIDDKEILKKHNSYLVDVIKFVLDNGFDLSKDNGKYGALCLANLIYSTHDENIVYAAKLLLDNGAKNIVYNDEAETPLTLIATETSYLLLCEESVDTSYIFEALCKVIEYADNGKNYNDVDIYFNAKDKTIKKVLKAKDEKGIFDINNAEYSRKNCFETTIYFEFDEGYLAIDRYTNLIYYKNITEETDDISSLFENYIGKTIKSFDLNTIKVEKQSITGKGLSNYIQTVARINFDNELTITFADNNGESKTIACSFDFNKKKELTEIDRNLIGLMKDMGFEKNCVIGVCIFLENTVDREKLLKYLLFKGKYATEQDALAFSHTIERANGKRYQYLPQNLFMRYIKETTNELNNGDYYQVHTVYNLKNVVYYMMNEQDEMKEYPAEDFIKLRPSLIEYTGVPDDNGGETKITDGFEVGKQYKVIAEKGWQYVLEDGREIPFFETDAIEFVPAEEKPIGPIAHEELLYMLRRMFEFGDMKQIYKRMTDKTVYVSHGKDLTITGRDNILDYIEEISKNRVEENAFSDVVLATVTNEKDELYKKGVRFLVLFHDDKTIDSAFLTDDGTYITKIDLYNGHPAYQCGDTLINNLGEKK